jgi:hypothetical protein
LIYVKVPTVFAGGEALKLAQMPTLNWHKREEAVRAATRAPFRLLEPVAELSYGNADSENLLLNLERPQGSAMWLLGGRESAADGH